MEYKLESVKVDELDNMDEIELNTNNKSQVQIFKKKIILCNYYARVHILSYLYLKMINNIFITFFILVTFIEGLIQTINYNNETNKDLKLILGVLNFLLGILVFSYKSYKIPENTQNHYHSYNDFNMLKNKIEMNIVSINSDFVIYNNVMHYVNDTNLKLNELINNAPVIPYYILKKYNLSSLDICNKRNKGLKENKENKLVRVKSESFKIPKLKKSITIKDINKINTNDIDNFNEFLSKHKINEKNNDYIINDKINNFRKTFV